MEKSLLDIAYEIVSKQKGSISFSDLWKKVVEASGLNEEDAAKKISRFYTNLMLDGRFVTLGENQWDLRTRHTFDKVHIDMKDVYSDDEDTDIDEEDQEELEYEKEFIEEKSTVEEDSNESDVEEEL